MGFRCRIEADSVSPDGVRLTTFVVRFPRVLLAELNTHRVFSRNAGSSRAIPVSRRIADVVTHPFIPDLTVRGPGMASNDVVSDDVQREWDRDVRALRDASVSFATKWASRGHKQHVNRYLEPWTWVDVVVSATEWKGFFALRCHPAAQPEMQTIAGMMRDALGLASPTAVPYGGWHLPFVATSEKQSGQYTAQQLRALAVGRLRRVSYHNHDQTSAVEKDLSGYADMVAQDPPHASPFEHVATPTVEGTRYPGNFRGWRQLRHLVLREPGE